MEVNIHDKEKCVSVWLTRAESADGDLRERLKPVYAHYQQKKYRVVVFESGTRDLAALTSDLLKHNLELIARQEVEL